MATVTLRWNGNRATGLSIPKNLLPPVAAGSPAHLPEIRLVGTGNQTAVLGQYRTAGEEVLFEPLVPFTRGLRYQVWVLGKRLDEIEIPALTPGDAPALLAVFPSQDSLPENLLKIYLRFSRPMREGQAQKYVGLLNNENDTVPGVFLDLQPELWNTDRTVLTLWLDPGRIKRDLQPNRLLGSPLQNGTRYRLVVSAAWPDEQGACLPKSYAKSFVTVPRDSLSPDPGQWRINQPQPGTGQPLEVDLGETLDYSLLRETLSILDEGGKIVSGEWQVMSEEKKCQFKPQAVWVPGTYELRIESRLEDLSGNNLNRPFERDVARKNVPATAIDFFERPFRLGTTGHVHPLP
ncbi:MAG: hypothetical protein H7Z75_05805 [Ferruginibacter sp.]|nr:hypothetical protein [Cytophagales bacterium]